MLNFGNTSEADISISKKVYFAILILSFFWILFIIAAPIFMNIGGILKIPAEILYLFFSKTCHQFESRSFFLFDNPAAVCSRCLTIYIGFFFGIVLYPLKNKLNNTSVPPLYILFIFIIPLAADVFLDWAGIMSNTFFTRSLSGFVTGVILPFYLIPGFVKFFNEVILYLKNRSMNLN
ncbi:MAG: hypothetical protein HGGPFJEG_01078 [Ignavibacteria bacterium]|nr:hypothetical protein [Ignavibacteria bacterium]